MNILLKRFAVVVGILALSARPLIKTLLWLGKAPLDEKVGTIPVLSSEALEPYVKGKHVLLVGGTRGVGLGTAQALAAAGAHVTVVGRSEQSGTKAVETIRRGQQSDSTVKFVRGDIGTICSALELVKTLEEQKRKYDYAVVAAATFPDWTQPLQNVDGMDKSFGIAVVGRFLVYRNAHKFMKPQATILNVLASGESSVPYKLFNSDVALGTQNVTSLLEAMMTFSFGNEIMIDSLYKYDERYTKQNMFTMVSTHPGMIQTELHYGQGLAFDIFEDIMNRLIGISEEEAGQLQASILISNKLHSSNLTLVDHYGMGRVRDPAMQHFVELNRDWLWKHLLDLERRGNTNCA